MGSGRVGDVSSLSDGSDGGKSAQSDGDLQIE